MKRNTRAIRAGVSALLVAPMLAGGGSDQGRYSATGRYDASATLFERGRTLPQWRR